jgi:hypothetical protein
MGSWTHAPLRERSPRVAGLQPSAANSVLFYIPMWATRDAQLRCGATHSENWGYALRRQLVLSAFAFGALIAPAMSADLAPYYKAPPVPACFWCGWYVGGNVGGTWMEDTGVQTGSTPISAAATFAPEAVVASALASNNLGSNKAGFIGGGQIGYNWVFGNYVA